VKIRQQVFDAESMFEVVTVANSSLRKLKLKAEPLEPDR